MIQKLASVVAMKPDDAEWELVQNRFQHGNHVPFADGFHASDVLPLCHRVQVDVMDAPLAILLALMHGVHA